MKDFDIYFAKFAPYFSLRFLKNAVKIGFNIYFIPYVIRVNFRMPKGRKVLFSNYLINGGRPHENT